MISGEVWTKKKICVYDFSRIFGNLFQNCVIFVAYHFVTCITNRLLPSVVPVL